MEILLSGECTQRPDAYIALLLKEDNLSGNGFPVVQDLVHLSVRGGNDLY